MNIILTKEEMNLIIMGMTGSQYPQHLQKAAFELVMKLRDSLRETT